MKRKQVQVVVCSHRRVFPRFATAAGIYIPRYHWLVSKSLMWLTEIMTLFLFQNEDCVPRDRSIHLVVGHHVRRACWLFTLFRYSTAIIPSQVSFIPWFHQFTENDILILLLHCALFVTVSKKVVFFIFFNRYIAQKVLILALYFS